MKQKIERKGRNPRITVCYTPEEYKMIVDNAAACGLKKSQYIHDASLGQEPKVMMSDKEADALMSLKAARGELILIKFACLHFDAKSDIPHLHILINCIDLDGNLMNDSFIGDSAVKAAHDINIERGWELPEDIHEEHQKEITEACYDILRGMSSYDWDSYKHALESRGYKVHEQRDKQGDLHGYTILRGNSRFKSSILGKGRNLTAPRLEETWKKLHPVAQSVVKPNTTVGTSQTTERKPLTERNSGCQSITQTKPEAPRLPF